MEKILKTNAKKPVAYLYLLGTFFLWGSLYVATKYALMDVSTVTITGGRYVIAFIVLLIVGHKHLKVKIEKSDWKYFVMVGFLGYYMNSFLGGLSVRYLGASNAALINALNPVSITIVAAILLKEKINWVKILCIVLAFAGTAVITKGVAADGQMIGVVIALSALIFWAVASVTLRRMGAKYGAMTVTLYGIMVCLLFYIPTAAVDCVRNGGFHISLRSGLAVVYLGVFGTAVATFCWSKALSMLEASRCSLFYPLQALFSSLLGTLILKEQFKATFFIGAAIITANVLINCLYREKEPETNPVVSGKPAVPQAESAAGSNEQGE